MYKVAVHSYNEGLIGYVTENGQTWWTGSKQVAIEEAKRLQRESRRCFYTVEKVN